MRAVINTLPARVGGGVTFFTNLLPALGRIQQAGDQFVILIGPSQKALDVVIPPDFERKKITLPKNYVLRVLWEQLVLPVRLLLWKADVYYSSGNSTTLLAPCPTVILMTGSNHYSSLGLPRMFGGVWKQRLIRFISYLSALRSKFVVFISKNSRRLILTRLRIPRERAPVIYYGFKPEDPETLEGRIPPGDFILTVCVLFPHKNLERLMRSFDRFVSETGYDGALVIAGSQVTPDYDEELFALRASLRNGDQIVFTGHLTHGEVSWLYRRASVFVFPSLEETLGVPLLEAMGYGVPIAAADCRLAGRDDCFNPFREIAGDAAIYFNPFDESSILEALKRLTEDSELCSELRTRGWERIRAFDWDEAARRTIQVLRRAAGIDRGNGERAEVG